MIRFVFFGLEALMLVIFAVPLFNGILNAGNAAGIAVSAALAVITVFFDGFWEFVSDTFRSTAGKVILISCAVIIGAAVIGAAVLSFLMARALMKTNDDAKALVVLGCKVNGTEPSRMLTRRLESARAYLSLHPDTVCVVSGGKGSDEKISEALSMKNYLVRKGISEGRIIMEDRSENTDQNLRFSSELLRSAGIDIILTVTDGFHQYRASLIAKKYGLECSALNAGTDPLTKWLIPTYWVREWMAIAKELFSGKVREIHF